MNDTDILDQLRACVPDVHLQTPLEQIIATGRSHRRARRTAFGAIAATTVLGATIAVAALGTSTGSTSAPPAGGHANLAAFTIATQPSGATALTLRKGAQYKLDPDALRQALAAHNIPAVVEVGRSCDSKPAPPNELDQVVRPQRLADGSVTLLISPSALPVGAEVSIGYYPSFTTWSLVERGATLICTSHHHR